MERPISELLSALSRVEDVEQEIYDHYYRLAWQAARRRIDQSIQSRVDPSDLANMSLKSALSDLAGGKLRGKGSEGFKAHLLAIVRNKVASAARAETAQKRTVQPQGTDADPIPVRELPPDRAAVVNEQVERFLYELLPEQDPLDLVIGYRHFLQDSSAEEIHSWLEAHSKATGARAIGTRAVQLRIQRLNKRLEDLLKE